jgi:hypothetical protein
MSKWLFILIALPVAPTVPDENGLKAVFFKHLKANGIKDASLFNSSGEIEFSMSNPQYIN